MIPSRIQLLASLVIPVTLAASLPAPPKTPALLVIVTVDQLRADYLGRWRTEWTGGFRRLLDSGAVMAIGLQDHALTETAPGHATILSGRYPAHTGIVINALGVPDSSAPVIGFPHATGASPNRFLGTTLVDWMRRGDPGLRVLSVSGKDRGAILPIGRTRANVFWYHDGVFTTSRYYADSLPSWLASWNARGGAARMAGRQWTLLEPDSDYAEPDSEPWENGGVDVVFPHAIPADTARALEALTRFPWLDSLTIDVALEGARALQLGQRASPDLLALSLSATDYIGHHFGPDSREIHDQLLRLDRWLGNFLDSLATMVPRDRIVVVLTADHGVTPFPEETAAHGKPAGRIRLGAFVRDVNLVIGRRTGDSGILRAGSGIIYGDTARLRSLGVSPESLATVLAPRVWSLPGISNAWTPGTLGGASPRDVDAVRWWKALSPRFSWLVCAAARPNYIWSDGSGETDHGSTNDDDVRVPIIFMGKGFAPGVYRDTARTTDIAPTLARLLAVDVDGKIDGRAIKRIFR